MATSAASFFRSLGGALGVALSGAWMTARLHRLLPLDQATSLGDERRGPQHLRHLAHCPRPQRTVVVHAYRQAIGSTFLLGAGVAALGLLVVLALPERPLRSAASRSAEGRVEAEPA